LALKDFNTANRNRKVLRGRGVGSQVITIASFISENVYLAKRAGVWGLQPEKGREDDGGGAGCLYPTTRAQESREPSNEK